MGRFSDSIGRRSRKRSAEQNLGAQLIAFAEPMISELVGDDESRFDERHYHGVLQIAMTFWNAHVLRQMGKDAEMDALLQGIYDELPPDTRTGAIIRGMAERKATLFGDDLRFISEFEMIPDQGKFHVRVIEGFLRPADSED
jgi:hypothetical protein